MKNRKSGIFLHITSLPNRQGIGTLGKEAFEFIDVLKEAGVRIWQICPLGPTGYGDSPYQTFSAFAGNSLLLDMNDLVSRGLLEESDLHIMSKLLEGKVDYGWQFIEKNRLLKKAYGKFKKDESFDNFCAENVFWLQEYALFMALKEHFGGRAWSDWPAELKMRDILRLEKFTFILQEKIDFYKFLQFIFRQQWDKLHNYASAQGVEIFGDIPIFVALDSADAWSNQPLFQFDEKGNPISVAGVPPDYFSATGQLWGNPLYDWQKMRADGFSWWEERFGYSLRLFDLIRVDHFRGFAGYWAVAAGEPTAENGSWEKAPGGELFDKLQQKFGDLPIVAEDLGVITADVTALKDRFGFPGMKILQFAFGGGDDNPYLPENYEENCAAYTGTHDNDTSKGWFDKLSEKEKREVCEKLNCNESEICRAMIRAIWQSKADLAIAPLQDFLELGSEARLNTPGTSGGNWQWRLKANQISEDLTEKIRLLNEQCGR